MDYSKLVSDAVAELCKAKPTKETVAKYVKRAFDAGWDAALDEAAKQTGVSKAKIVDIGGVNVAQNLADAILSLKKRH